MKDFRDLKVWAKAHKLTLKIYKVTKDFPKDELYGVTSQIRRASISIPTNIAEGCGRDSDPQLRRFFEFAMGSASEVEYLLLLSNDLEYIHDPLYAELSGNICEIKKMLATFIKKIHIGR